MERMPTGRAAPSGFAAVTAAGNVTVSGANLSVSLKFDIPGFTYGVSFSEEGLPPQTPWTIDLNGTNQTTTAAEFVYNLTNGSYAYHLNCSQGFVPTIGTGVIVVAGHAAQTNVQFVPVNFTLTIPGGRTPERDHMGRHGRGVLRPDLNLEPLLPTPERHLPLQRSGPIRVSIRPANGSVYVNGTSLYVPIVFTQTPLYNVTFTQLGLPTATPGRSA